MTRILEVNRTEQNRTFISLIQLLREYRRAQENIHERVNIVMIYVQFINNNIIYKIYQFIISYACPGINLLSIKTLDSLLAASRHDGSDISKLGKEDI